MFSADAARRSLTATFASAIDAESSIGPTSRARGPQFLACQRQRLIVIKLARCLEAAEECSQVIRADGAVDDLALGGMRLCRVFAEDGCDLGVEVDADSFAGCDG